MKDSRRFRSQSPDATVLTMVYPLHELDSSIQKLKNLSYHLSSNSPKTLAEVYLASIALLVNLKVDQSTLQKTRIKDGEAAKCPPPEEIPTISAVVQDARLFRALLRCLQSKGSGGSDSEVLERQVSLPSVVGRKRALSTDNDRIPNKSIKLAHSPVPGTRHKVNHVANNRKPSWNVQAMAATILYTAFQHLDHWPAPLVKAYADDCFGPRLWVDDDRCRLLVGNLALAHCREPAQADDQKLRDASTVADAYREFELMPPDDEDDTYASFPSHVHRGSMSSTGSSKLHRGTSLESAVSLRKQQTYDDGNSDSVDEEECFLDSAVRNAEKLGDGDDSSSGGEDEEVVRNAEKLGDGDDSSSGEEDEEVVVTEKSNGIESMDVVPENQDAPLSTSTNGVDPDVDAMQLSPKADNLYPIRQSRLDVTRVRQRFFGANLVYAYDSVSSSLLDRLDVKTKQNSGLLQSLPAFTPIPGVRFLIATNLEKWLQSPALAGLARTLFSSTVNQMKNVDPPLEEDLKSIDCVLAMKLKANLFNAHVENITVIAKRIPTGSVTNHMYFKLLREALAVTEAAGTPNSDKFKMIAAIHRAIPSRISYEAIAASLLMMLVNPPAGVAPSDSTNRVERLRLVKRLRGIIRAIASELRPSFDGCLLLESLLSFDVSSDSWSTRDEEDKARLMFQCVTLFASSSLGRDDVSHKKLASTVPDDEISPSTDISFRKSLRTARKLLLTWCCTDYGPRWATRRNRRRAGSNKESDDMVGAGIPDFASALGSQVEEKIPSWLNTMRCLLFMEDASSPLMKRFFCPDGAPAEDEIDWQEEHARIRTCCACGVILDDEMVWTVLKSCNLPEGGMASDMAIQLLEHLFESCSKVRGGSLEVTDPILVWELYNLVEYTPAKLPRSESTPLDDDGPDSFVKTNGEMVADIPRLANPGLWWRVTMLALVMSAVSPDLIGIVVWKEHPTLRALTKMVTSARYRFPTVDSDERMRDEMKKCEQAARDEETKIAELLFLPPRPDKKKSKKLGSRVSRRLQRQHQEKEAAEELAEVNHRKKMLRAAQKSIMLWNPVGPARKPPRESADLLMSVEEAFGLSEVLQRSVNPDFILLTIGQTTRGAIELAYDWLIPIISRLPGAIDRLPSSTSCFLLLRAYGTDGEERKQLRELSAPLLLHVQDSLRGRFGESDAVQAFDLLMSDAASNNPDRRRCARRVLHDSLAQLDDSASGSKSSWMLNVLRVDHAKALVCNAIKHMSTAATFERGKVLCHLLMALEKHIAFAETHRIEVKWKFSTLLVRLISSRPGVYAEAMDTFSDLRSLAIRVAHDEFARCAKEEASEDGVGSDGVVIVKLFPTSFLKTEEVELPLSLLQSISVLLSIWKDQDDQGDRDTAGEGAVNELVDSLMRSNGEEGSEGGESTSVGLASARMADSSIAAVSVESWIMLAKARSDSIARRAALSAPTEFLPRLLLCSGLPRASLLTMIDRLGRLGEADIPKDVAYIRLLDPSASSEWDIGRVGGRRDISRKLLGRLSAYLRLNEVSSTPGESEVSTTFLDWLSEVCRSNHQKLKKPKQKRGKAAIAVSVSSVAKTPSVLSTLFQEELDQGLPNSEFRKESPDLPEFVLMDGAPKTLPDLDDDMASIKSLIGTAVDRKGWRGLDNWLERNIRHLQMKSALLDTDSGCVVDDIAIQLLESFRGMKHTDEGLQAVILKWVPVLSRSRGKDKLWRLLFSQTDWPPASLVDSLLSMCMASWSQQHVSSCCGWIISMSSSEVSGNHSIRMVRFLVATSRQTAVQIESLSEVGMNSSHPSWFSSEHSVIAASSMAFECARQESYSETGLPSWLALLLLLANGGNKYLTLVCDAVLRQISASETKKDRGAFQAALLRLYLCHPYKMNLGTAAIRNLLTEAADNHAEVWVNWPSCMDDPLAEMLLAVTTGDLKLAKPLSDVSRKHPLLMLRMIQAMTSFLQGDAIIDNGTGGESRGVIRGQSLSGPCEARIAGRTVQVTIRHWGFNYTEPVWAVLLDIVTSIPNEVLFTCSRAVGLLDFFAVYLELLSVQLQLRSADKTARLKGKLSSVFATFKEMNPEEWSEWMGEKIGELEVRHLLMICDFITPEEAIESIKNLE